jgi:hypothetical protein
MNNLIVSRGLAIVLIFCLCGVPQALAQTPQALPDSPSYTWQTRRQPSEIAAALPPQQPQEPAPQQPESLPAEEEQLPETDAQESDPAEQVPTDPATPSQVDPTQGPLQPVPGQDPNQQEQQPQTERFEGAGMQPQTQRMEAQAPPTRPPEPAGTAAAERGPVAGGAASKPAGTAIAPAKQRQVRSFLIRMGAVIAGAAALGTVYALSKGSPSTPPGSNTTGTRR